MSTCLNHRTLHCGVTETLKAVGVTASIVFLLYVVKFIIYE
ncbi:hypothetical protein ACUIJN_18745 [Metabacillus halosaccharovorans]|nr:hypothetical protein [Metabacillus halosaccharovorans]